MELDDRALLDEYIREESQKTLELGKKLCKWGLPVVLLIAILEIYIYHNITFVLCRLLFIVPAIAYYVFALSPYSKDKPQLVLPLHLATISGGLFMMSSLALIKLQLNDIHPAMQMASVTGGLVVIIFVAYVFAGGAVKYLRYILTLTLSLLLLFILLDGSLTWREISLFINPVVATLTLFVLSISDERRSYRDFKHRKEIELQQVKLQQELEERKTIELKLQQQLEEDYLTGAYNRRAAFSLLDNFLNVPQPFSICYIDIDDFKKVNDRYGHSQGDMLLIAFSEYLKENIRKSDFLCRIGGDEFLVILPNCPPTEAQNIIERVHSNFFRLHTLNNIKLNFSYGFCHYNNEKVSNSYELLELADRNMYDCKAAKQ